MQLVGGKVRVLRPGAGPNKTDLVVDDAKVEEIMGVPPEKVADVMALMGDSIDNIPGAKGIGEKGARELILRFGSAEAALERAKEVEGKRYREALENSRDAVLMSKQLAIIDTNAPVKLVARRSRAARAGRRSPARDLRGTGFHFPAARSSRCVHGRGRRQRFRGARIARGAQEISRCASAKQPKSPCGSRSAEGERETEGFGTRIAAIEISPEAGVSRTALARPQRAKCSPRSANSCAIPRGRKSCTIPNSSICSPGPSREFATRRCCIPICCAPPHRNTASPTRCCAQENVTLSGAPGEHADHLQRLAPLLRKEVEAQGLAKLYETIDLPLAPVLASMERHGVRVDRKALGRDVQDDGTRNPRASKKPSGSLPDRNSTSIRRSSLPKFCSTR